MLQGKREHSLAELERPIYAIGDVHGRADLLRALLDAIEADAGAHVPRIIFLGDIIDRGPDSKEALELVDEALDRFPGSQLILGNHDEYLLHALEGLLTDTDVTKWLNEHGGRATIDSYLPGAGASIDQFTSFVHQWYDHHHILLRQATDKVIIGNYCLVHAGIRPGVPIADQNTYDMRWIREEFLEHRGSFEHVIVHGHAPTDSGMPEVHANRIALDTGACFSDRLTACRLLGEGPPRFLMTSLNDEKVVVSCHE